jgi:hypothetical protein
MATGQTQAGERRCLIFVGIHGVVGARQFEMPTEIFIKFVSAKNAEPLSADVQ